MKTDQPLHRYNLRRPNKNTGTVGGYVSCAGIPKLSKRRAVNIREARYETEQKQVIEAVKEIHAGGQPNLALLHFHRIMEEHLNWMGWQPLPLSPIGMALLRNGNK